MNFPVECFEDIFYHLSGNELLKYTLVCPEWNNFIESTRSCMKKIKVEGNKNSLDCSLHNPLKTFLVHSKRNYECLELFGSNSENFKELLTVNKRKWTDISAKCVNFESNSHFFDFLRSFQLTIQKLVVRGGKIIKDVETDPKHLDLLFP